MIDRESILAADDLPREQVHVPEWGGHVFVKTMRGFERDAWEVSLQDETGKPSNKNVRAKLAVATVVDEDGRLVFEPGDADELGNKSCAALDRIFTVSARLNGITDRDLEELESD